MPDPVLILRKLSTSEDELDQRHLDRIREADKLAGDLVVGGVLMSRDASCCRLTSAIDQLVGETLCGCAHCESSHEVALDRSENAYYLGLTVGLRLARATDGATS